MRTISLLLGLLSILVAMASPVAVLDDRMLTAHMAQHLLLMTVAPPLIWLGLPAHLLTRPMARWAGHPVFCWLAATVALVGWHTPAGFRFGMQSGFWHLVEQVSFLAAGLLFWLPVIQPPRRWWILLYLFLATLPCDVLSGLLVFSDRVAYPIYLCTPHKSGLSPLEDQQCAAALMWTCVTVVFLVAGTIVSTQMLSPKPTLQEVASL
ncbi:MAG: cytochrome c oxidase assembly protein, partial [Acidobacteriia bacterium]|nr:cytochrome c oxidase assembly protein [Terriglobia bacterium]